MGRKLIHRTNCRRRILEVCEEHRPQLGIRRVSAEALDRLEVGVEAAIRDLVERHPSVGVTFKP